MLMTAIGASGSTAGGATSIDVVEEVLSKRRMRDSEAVQLVLLRSCPSPSLT